MATEADVLQLLRNHTIAATFVGELAGLMDEMDAEGIPRTAAFYDGALELGKELGITQAEIGRVLYRDAALPEDKAPGTAEPNGHAKDGNGYDKRGAGTEQNNSQPHPKPKAAPSAADHDWGAEPEWGWQANNEIPRDYIDGLKARVPIFQVIKKYTKLTRRGPNQDWDGRSPFRDDKNPGSFKVSDKFGRANDFATGESWDHIDAIMAMEHKEFHEAVEILASMAGLPMWVKEKLDFKNPLALPFKFYDENRKFLYERVKLGYVTQDGKPVMKDGKRAKEVLFRRPDGRGGSIWRLWQDVKKGDPPAVGQVPYGLPDALDDLKADSMITLWSAESEQSVDDLRKLGATAISISKGVSKDDLARWFTGVDHIALRDNDKGGRDHADLVLGKMDGIAARQRFLDLPGLQGKEGPDNWIGRGGTLEKLYDLGESQARDWKPETQSEKQRAEAPQVQVADAPQEWPDPHPLPRGLLPVKPFDLELMPQKLRSWVSDVSDRMQCPPDFVAVGVMAALGTVLGRKVAIRPMAHNDWTVVANQWALIIGRPGVLKSPAMEEALRSIKRLAAKAQEVFDKANTQHAVEEKIAELVARDAVNRAREHLAAKKEPKKEGRKSRKGEQADQRPQDEAPEEAIARARRELEIREYKLPEGPTLKRYIVNDTNIASIGLLHQQNSNGLLVFRDELISLLDSLGQEDKVSERGFYLTAWNGDSPYTFDRIGRGLHMHIPGLCLSMLGGAQPGRIAEYVLRAVRGGRFDDGLIQRFGLAVWPDNSGPWRNVDRLPGTSARKEAHEVFEQFDVLDWRAIGAARDRSDTGDEEGLPYLRFSIDGYDRFVNWRTDLERRLRSGELHPAMESHLAKYRKLVPGLALLSCLADGGTRYVDVNSVERATKWAAYLESHADRIYGSGPTAKTETAEAIIAKIKSGALKSEFGSKDVWRPGWSKLSDKDLVKDALGMLVEYDHLAQRKVETAGRPQTLYVVNPKILRV
jgi:hypothetical protein